MLCQLVDERKILNPEYKELELSLAVLGVAQVATGEMLAAQLGLRTMEQMKKNYRQNIYGPEFWWSGFPSTGQKPFSI